MTNIDHGSVNPPARSWRWRTWRRTLVLSVSAAVALWALLPAPALAEFPGTPGKFAFLDGSYRVAVSDPVTGAGPTALTDNTFCVTLDEHCHVGLAAPAWSPDGTKIAYSKSVPDPAGGEHSAIFVTNADGTGAHQVSQPPAGQPARGCPAQECPDDSLAYGDSNPTWSPDGSQLAFLRGVDAGPQYGYYDDETWEGAGAATSGIFTVPASGGVGTPLVNEGIIMADYSLPAGFNTIAWSPARDGHDEIAAVDDQARLLLVNPRSGAQTPIADGESAVQVDWSPDGARLAYSAEDIVGGDLVYTGKVYDSGKVTTVPEVTTPLVRFSPDGNGIIHEGCAPAESGGQKCGLVERVLDDAGRDSRADDPTERYLGPAPSGVGPTLGLPTDVQAQQLPIIFLPGFLGSTIACGGDVDWPPTAFGDNGKGLTHMRLGADGRTNEGCADAHPTGTALGKVVGQDIYQGVQDWLQQVAPGTDGKPNHAVFGWDWRKAPSESFDRLDTAVQDALKAPLAQAEGATRVVFYGHSYGGLLARAWMASAPARAHQVARVLTAGSPWWGAVKPIFPLSAGIESPDLLSGMDALLPNDALKALAQNLAGLYELLPSDHFGPWLSVEQAQQDQAGVAATIGQLGGNPQLFAQARGDHQANIDGFFDDDGRADVRAVVGTGSETVNRITLIPSIDKAVLFFGNGDGTVPLRSAQQGDDPAHPLGVRAHIQAVCGDTHVPLPNSPKVFTAYRDFLLSGRIPLKTEGSCPADGAATEIDGLPLPDTVTGGTTATSLRAQAGRESVRASADAASGAMTVQEAADSGAADVFAFPHPVVVTDARRPVTLDLSGQGVTITYTPLHDGEQGTPLTYGPVSGTITLTPGSGGAAPVVQANGAVVQPAGGGTGSGSSSGSGGTTGGGSGPSAPGSGTPTPPAVMRFRGLAARASGSVRHGRVPVRVTCPRAAQSACRGAVVLTTKTTVRRHGKRRTVTVVVGRRSFRVARGHTATVTVTVTRKALALLRQRGRHGLRVQLVATARDGAGRTATATRGATLKARG